MHLENFPLCKDVILCKHGTISYVSHLLTTKHTEIFQQILCIYFFPHQELDFIVILGFPGSSVGKESTCNAGDTRDTGSIPAGGYDNALQYSCLENPVDRRAWGATVHEVTKELDPT